jgi:hypothetical protein
MKFIATTALIIFSGVWAYAQPSFSGTIKWGTQNREIGTTEIELLYTTAEGYYVLQKQMISMYRISIYLLFLDLNLNQIVSKELTFEYNGKSLKFIHALHLNGELYLFTSYTNMIQNKNYLFVQTLNKATLQLNNDLRPVSEFDVNPKEKTGGHYHISVSNDSAKVVVMSEQPELKNGIAKFSYKVFSNQMQEIWSKEMSINVPSTLFIAKEIIVSNQGDVFLLGKLFKQEFTWGRPEYSYSLISCSDMGQNVSEYYFQADDKVFTDVKITIGLDSNIICGGFYSETNTQNLDGYFILKIDDKTHEVIETNYYKLSIDFLTQSMSEKEESNTERKAGKSQSNRLLEYDIRNIVLWRDGGIILVGEQYYDYSITVGNNESKYYMYNNIIVVKISPKGKIEWNVAIPKRQYSVNDNGRVSSFYMSIVDDQLYFIFNDNLKNLNYKNGDIVFETAYSNADAIASIVKVDEIGHQERELLYRQGNDGGIIRPKVCNKINDKEILLFSQIRRKNQFARVTFH